MPLSRLPRCPKGSKNLTKGQKAAIVALGQVKGLGFPQIAAEVGIHDKAAGQAFQRAKRDAQKLNNNNALLQPPRAHDGCQTKGLILAGLLRLLMALRSPKAYALTSSYKPRNRTTSYAQRNQPFSTFWPTTPRKGIVSTSTRRHLAGSLSCCDAWVAAPSLYRPYVGEHVSHRNQ
ncbi:hypothetical protein K505DRAFT_365623 [Melanomma pulvis-pyrius CBS 109.77]|uniref:Uncharacterized protein n=1 Tax=Melanomma pulvis-pyrius CBS 109.77 TaxID=1314802 RepID=A0A6A6WZA9_9PLEO|nr:hypothetical protein K505DRAFT_365623 [Melanomma pulvis-pyrius CBS 109.77]